VARGGKRRSREKKLRRVREESERARAKGGEERRVTGIEAP
jgi:hypothetical protein